MKIGTTIGFTVTDNVVCTAHCPALGVKVYSVVAVLLMEGDQLSVIPLPEVVGNGAKTLPAQIEGTALKAGTIPAELTVTTREPGKAHCPAVGVKV